MAVIMAGGRSSRFRSKVEKAMLEVGGKPLLLRVLEALQVEGISDVAIAVSPHVPETRREAERLGLRTVDTSGDGYHEDVTRILEDTEIFLTANVDVPFLRRSHVEKLLEGYDGGSVAAVVNVPDDGVGLYDGSTVTAPDGSRLVWVGLNIVTPNPKTRMVRLDDPLLAVNINDEEDLARADSIAVERGV
ncbi:TPA: NTP transferase domain-containing protein [Thermoplasmata archaeon]|nr:NTP transferase domain-containing protein [Thermoplasmata archaeon]